MTDNSAPVPASVHEGDALELAAPAKVNLWLRVLGRRLDGYHEIESRMVPLALADRVVLRRLAEGSAVKVTCGGGLPDAAGLPVGEENLAVKAVRALERETGGRYPVAIELEKRIPSGAGLGGGSSDAASVLRGVDELFGLGLGRERLAEIGAKIGADVAFFCYGGACDCRGIGDVVEPVAGWPVEPIHLLLVKPAFGVPTPWAYRMWAESRVSGGVGGANHQPQEMLWGTMVNDLERPVFQKHLVLPTLKEWLLSQAGVLGALMSGSGATVFAVLEDEAAGEAIEGRVAGEFGESTWTCRTEVLG